MWDNSSNTFRREGCSSRGGKKIEEKQRGKDEMRGDYKGGEERKGEKKVRKARLEVQRN